MNKLPSLAAIALLLAACTMGTGTLYQVGTAPIQDRAQAERTHADLITKLSSPDYDSVPQVITSHFPDYPPDWYVPGIRIDAEVIVTFTVEADGRVSNPIVAESAPPQLGAATLNAIMQWKFRPAIKNGAPISARVQQAFIFKTE